MEQERFARVAELMGDMAAGDVHAAFTLGIEYAHPLRAAVRRAARARGRELPASEVDELVADVVLVLHDHAAAWRPDGGALPWVWASRRIANAVDRHLGLYADRFDADHHDVEVPPPAAGEAEPTALAVLDRLAHEHQGAALLADALRAVASPRDGELWLEMLVQEALGDRAPATSVGPRLGLSAEAARQQKRRVHARLRRLAGSDSRYAVLAELAAVA